MSRFARLIQVIAQERDFRSAVFLAMLLMISCWLVGMTFTRSIPRATMERFHLQTPSFAFWSAQQLIPSMYNLENEFEFESDVPAAESLTGYTKVRYLNHFPLRVVTYFDYRYGLFHAGNGGNLVVTSRYRDQSLTTRWRIRRIGNELHLELVNSP